MRSTATYDRLPSSVPEEMNSPSLLPTRPSVNSFVIFAPLALPSAQPGSSGSSQPVIWSRATIGCWSVMELTPYSGLLSAFEFISKSVSRASVSRRPYFASSSSVYNDVQTCSSEEVAHGCEENSDSRNQNRQ